MNHSIFPFFFLFFLFIITALLYSNFQASLFAFLIKIVIYQNLVGWLPLLLQISVHPVTTSRQDSMWFHVLPISK